MALPPPPEHTQRRTHAHSEVTSTAQTLFAHHRQSASTPHTQLRTPSQWPVRNIMICCTRCDRSSLCCRSACRGMCHHSGERARSHPQSFLPFFCKKNKTKQSIMFTQMHQVGVTQNGDDGALLLGPRECACSTNVAAAQLQCGPSKKGGCCC